MLAVATTTTTTTSVAATSLVKLETKGALRQTRVVYPVSTLSTLLLTEF